MLLPTRKRLGFLRKEWNADAHARTEDGRFGEGGGTPKPASFRSEVMRLSAALSKMQGDGLTPEGQRGVRQAARDILKKYGLTPTRSRPEEGSLGVIRGTSKSLGTYVAKTGAVVLSPKVLRGAGEAFQRLAAGKPLTAAHAESVNALLHEEIHGTSRADSASAVGIGVGMEEAVTETIARAVTRDITGLSTKGCYDRQVRGLAAAVQDAGLVGSGHRSAVEEACLHSRRGAEHPDAKSGNAAVPQFVAAAGGTREQQTRLREILSGVNSPVKP